MPLHSTSTVDTLFFDAVGTLIYPAEAVGQTYAQVAARYGVSISPASAEAAFRHQCATRPSPSYEAGHGSESVDLEWWRLLVTSVISTAASTPPPTAVQNTIFSALSEYYSTQQAWRLFPEVPLVLEVLAQRPVQLLVVSNFDARLHSVLDALDLTKHFAAVVISSEAGATKPSPKIFRHALEAADTTPSMTLHIGDDPIADEMGANDVGIEAFLVCRPERSLIEILTHPRLPEAR